MSFFDSFLDTASKGLDWLSNNQAALDAITGAAKGYGAYLQYKQQGQQYDLLKQQFADSQDRKVAPSAYNAGDFTTGLSTFKPGVLLNGNMANTMGVK